jgi:hypothetical protein
MTIERTEDTHHEEEAHRKAASAPPVRICFSTRRAKQEIRNSHKTKNRPDFSRHTKPPLSPHGKQSGKPFCWPILRNGPQPDTMNQGWLQVTMPQQHHSKALTTHRFQGTLVRHTTWT